MSEVSVKLTIAGRVYPITVEKSEEDSVQMAAAKINDFISEFQKAYGVKDMQDLLAMTALRISTEEEEKSASVSVQDDSEWLLQLKELDKTIKSFLNS